MSTLQLPDPLAIYLGAEATADTDVLERCFHSGAVVHDEGRTMRGLEAIKSWKHDSRIKYRYSVLMRVAGTFPGSPIELLYSFVVEGDKIASLDIRPSRAARS